MLKKISDDKSLMWGVQTGLIIGVVILVAFTFYDKGRMDDCINSGGLYDGLGTKNCYFNSGKKLYYDMCGNIPVLQDPNTIIIDHYTNTSLQNISISLNKKKLVVGDTIQ